ncbi:hypothetical protein [uncultured Amnibacterium sp.]|uniref:hypothetical protein n=1 Tax=uncultured Amnibacterium sp. TaxID=1631851 RepID=UPI0035CBF827
MHVRNPEAHKYDAREVAVDVRTGTVRAELHITKDGKDYSKRGTHTFTNPALSRIEAQAELVSAYNDPNRTQSGNAIIGVSQSGTTYKIVVTKGAIHGWPLAPNLAPPPSRQDDV